MLSPRLSSRWLFLALGATLALPMILLAKNFVKPVAKTAINYPAHDLHRDEKVAIAADPYDTPEKEEIFPVSFEAHGFLPVFLVVTNDGDQPISMVNLEITLITANHSKLTPTSPADVYRRLSNPQMSTRPSPIPLPGKKVKGMLSKKDMDDIESARFAAKGVEPHGSQSGFLFFDVGDIRSPLAGANIDITGVSDAKGAELLYFEIPMDKYLDAPKNP
jgi:hypothetical protein